MTKGEFADLLEGTILDYGRRWDKPRVKFELMPWQFLQLAEDNLKDTGRLVDALSNIKRALDCQIELIIFEHGFGKRLRDKKWSFPRKIRFLKDYGIMAPRILSKINRTRNLLEHEFRNPEREQVEDDYDVVTLFIGYCGNLRRVPDTISIGFDEKTTRAYGVVFDKPNLAFKVFDGADLLFVLHENEPGFDRLLRLFHGTQPPSWRLVHSSEFDDYRY